MIVRFNRWYNAVLTALLSILGYTSCSNDEDDERFVEMYGVIATEFQFKGQVTDEAGTPVQGIKTSVKIIIPSDNGKRVVFAQDSVLTDATGHYELRDYGIQSNETKLLVEDIDGEANGGEFQNDTLDIDYEKAIIKKAEGSSGSDIYEMVQDIKLKKK